METHQEIIEASTADGPMAVVVTQPAKGSHPPVLLFMDGPGIRPDLNSFAIQLAGEGFRVVTPDLYHRQGSMLPGFSDEQLKTDPDVGKKIFALILTMTDADIQSDGRDALAAAGVAEDTPCLTLGFCLGARAVFRALFSQPERFVAGAAWHPSFLVDDADDSPHLLVGDLQAPFFLGVGLADTVQSVAMHQPFFDAVADMPNIEVEFFPGANHGFTWPGRANYHAAAAEGCWEKTTALFAAAAV